MATIDLPAILRGIGDDLEESVRNIGKSLALPPEIRDKGVTWAAGAASELVKAGVAKANNDGAAYDAAMREIGFYRNAVKAIAVAEVMVGLHATEVEARKRLSEAVDLGISIGLKVLAAALI